jgi:hypothetical protein
MPISRLLSRTLFLAAMVAFLKGAAIASSFQILGIRPLGMGGAQVADPEGSGAAYWNPGGLGLTQENVIDMPIGAHFTSRGDVLGSVDAALDAVDAADAMKGRGMKTPSLAEAQKFTEAATEVTQLNEPGTGVIAGANAGVDSRAGHWAFSFNNFTEAGASPWVDTHLQLSDASVPSSPSLIDSQDAGLRDQVAGTLTRLQTQLGVTLPSNVTPTTLSNYLINQARAEGKDTAEIQSLVQQGQQLASELPAQPASNPPVSAVAASGSAAAASTDLLGDNQSQVSVRGAAVTEAALGRGWEIPLPAEAGQLGLGGNIKWVRGDLMVAQRRVAGDELSGLGKDFSQSRTTRYVPAMDLGALWRTPMRRRPWQVGLLARNLAPWGFKKPVDADGNAVDFPAVMNPLVRLGAAWLFTPRTTWTADLDLTSNPTLIPGNRSREFALGVEHRLGQAPPRDPDQAPAEIRKNRRMQLALRGGLLQDLIARQPPQISFGLGLRLGDFRMDVGAMASTRLVTIHAIHQTVPESFQFGLVIGSRFGGHPRERDLIYLPRHVSKPKPTPPPADPDVESLNELLALDGYNSDTAAGPVTNTSQTLSF